MNAKKSRKQKGAVESPRSEVDLERDETPKRCYGYVRVSTQQQVDEGMSLDIQTRKIKGWAAMSEYEIIEIIPDEGHSGRTIHKRPGIKRLLEIIKPGDALVAVAFSRLSRSVEDFLKIVNMLDKRGCRIVIVKEGLDTTTPQGRFAAVMFAAMAQLESEITGDRIKEAMAQKHIAGEFVGRIPYGWKLSDGPQSDLAEVPEEQAIIKRIRQLRETIDIKGKPMSYEKIAEILNSEHVKPCGKSSKWTHNSINRIYNRGEIITKGRAFEMREVNRKLARKRACNSDDDED